MKSIAEVIREKQAIYYPDGLPEYKDFKVGDRVQVITPWQDDRFFFDQTGVVTKNSGEYLGIIVSFDVPMEYEDGYILREYNFEPGDLVKLKKETQQACWKKICYADYGECSICGVHDKGVMFDDWSYFLCAECVKEATARLLQGDTK